MGKECGHDCNCDQEMNLQDIVVNNNIVMNGLIDLLIEKGVITEEDFRQKLAKIEKEMQAAHAEPKE
jgi:hypothetical protein